MATLSADIEKLEEAVRLLCEILPQFPDLKHDVTSIANELGNSWDGAASDYFVALLKARIKPIDDVYQALEYFKEYAEESKYNMKKLDEIINNVFVNPAQQIINDLNNNTTHTGSSGTTHGGGGTQLPASSSGSSSSSSASSNKPQSAKNIVEQAVEAITKPIKNVINGIKTLLGGKKK